MATKANLVIDQGSNYEVTLGLTDDNGDPIDLFEYTINAQIRKWYTSTNPSASFSVYLDASCGEFTLSLSANQTSNLVSGRYVYDVELNNNGTISRIIEGIVTVTPQVTR